jgi:sulfatase maturation enzyme AslB (radical SAM superfamily)
MANQKIFCNVPWINLHIYWDGSYGICCSESIQQHSEPNTYNLKFMPVSDWYNSKPIVDTRKQIKSDTPLDMCSYCYTEESFGYESRRIKENFKTAIFTEQAFERSYEQSPFIADFDNANSTTDRLPIDWHVDLGNECNFACKMCHPKASSKISALYDSWGLQEVSSNNNWTLDDTAWNNFKNEILNTKSLKRLHFMGGEPLLNKKFSELLNFLLEQRPDISLSFVTNGTYLTDDLINQLKKFHSCDLEISLESVSSTNDYIRQGANTADILSKIKKIASLQTDTFSVVLRSVPQLLSVNNYYEYIKFAWDNKISIQGVPLQRPSHLQISVLPEKIRHTLIPKYLELLDLFDGLETNKIVTGRNVGGLATQLTRETQSIIEMLKSPCPDNVQDLRQTLCKWLVRWDKEFDFDARNFYPEYTEFLSSIGYNV